jgi:hypothetical protein
MVVYNGDPATELPGVIAGIDVNEITITFGSTVNSVVGLWEYEMIAVPNVSGPDVLLGRGNLSFSPATGFTTQIQTLIRVGSLGIPMNEDWTTQNILYWKLYLQPQFELEDTEIYDDANWPPLSRFLIAKLVVHDWITHLMQTNLASSFGTTEEGVTTTTGSGGLKKLTTGPSSAEWYDTNESLTKVLTKGSSGTSAFDQLSRGVCDLAHRLRAYIPMCGLPSAPTILPVRSDARRIYPPTVTILTCLWYGPDRG